MDQHNGFELNSGQTTIFLQKKGNGPPLLLLHGFPETHLMWRDITALLEDRFTVICADLRGYGSSGCPASDQQHAPYSKRAMANDMVSIMEQLGFSEFFIAGHDRGGRVAYRMALDHPTQVKKLCVLDIIPTLDAWNLADKQFALDFWPWSLLAQTTPFPEQLILAAPEAIIKNVMTDWGTPESIFSIAIKEAYTLPLRNYEHVHAICEEYRAATSIDIEHDKYDLSNNHRIQCSLLVLWAANGPLDNWYLSNGGPLSIWKQWASDVRGQPIKGGHFFPEESPQLVAECFSSFFS
jgi:haloacetate dehalogenase